MRKVLLGVALLFLLLAAGVSAAIPLRERGASASTVAFAFGSEADAWVDQSARNENLGTGQTLRVDGSPLRYTYLRFNVEGLTRPVVRATLRLYTFSASTRGYQVHRVADSTWGERSITWSNAPPMSAAAGESGSFEAGTWTSVDVTPFVTGNGLVSFGLTAASDQSKTFASRESGANAPGLTVETAASTTTSSTTSTTSTTTSTT